LNKEKVAEPVAARAVDLYTYNNGNGNLVDFIFCCW
jgi:hypothetical protein